MQKRPEYSTVASNYFFVELLMYLFAWDRHWFKETVKTFKEPVRFSLKHKRKRLRELETENKPWREKDVWLVCPSSSQGKIPSSHQTKLVNSRSLVCKRVLTRLR